MTRYLLDTDILIDYSRSREPALSRIQEMIAAGDEVGLCAINVAEFYSGVLVGESAAWDQFISALTHWPITPQAALHAGRDRFHAFRRGLPISTADALIAAVAIEWGAVLVTRNARDYPMQDIELLTL